MTLLPSIRHQDSLLHESTTSTKYGMTEILDSRPLGLCSMPMIGMMRWSLSERKAAGEDEDMET